MTDAEITRAVGRLAGWQYRDRALEKTFAFTDFTAALAFMTAVAPTAERLNHHPDWSNSYNRVNVRLTSHDAGGVTERDFKLARAMEAASKQK